VPVTWTTRADLPARLPWRTAASKSLLRRIRCESGSTRGNGADSGGELGATLAPTRRDDRPTGTCPHAEAKAVRLGAAPVVRLERPLAHVRTPESSCERGDKPDGQGGESPFPARRQVVVDTNRHHSPTQGRGHATAVAVKPSHGTGTRGGGSNQPASRPATVWRGVWRRSSDAARRAAMTEPNRLWSSLTSQRPLRHAGQA
jgi:hypothetical protein